MGQFGRTELHHSSPSLSAKGTPDGFAVITAQLQVHSKDEINAVMRKLNGVNGVMTVNRAKG